MRHSEDALDLVPLYEFSQSREEQEALDGDSDDHLAQHSIGKMLNFRVNHGSGSSLFFFI